MADTLIDDLIVPDLSTEPGTYWCVHIPQGCSQHVHRLEDHFTNLAAQRHQTAIVARMASPHRGIRYLFKPETSVGWLMQEAGISGDEAKMIIESFGIHVRDELRQNAGNPRCLLGLAAALSENPEVLVYTTAGTDPIGRDAAFRYVEGHRSGRSVVHIAYPPAVIPWLNSVPRETQTEQGKRFCPPGATCVSLSKR